MACDYQAIRRDNERRYGTDIGRIGPMLLADRYDDRTHFIFEVLQNAEDALTRRNGWHGSRAVKFQLSEKNLRINHFGQPFDEADVRGICGIAESTKELNAIGRFGIGFKSVYAFTNRPEIHSGAESFAIENFVWPVAVPEIDRRREETVILIPLALVDESSRDEIAAGFERLGPSALLFLRQIEEIQWTIEGGRSGIYLRDSKRLDEGVRRVTVIGQTEGQTEVNEEWLVFSRPVTTGDGQHAGYVELAFSMTVNKEVGSDSIHQIERSPLVVFFPTILETHLGFLLQGPYRTTPSRDNVPRTDPWNQHLVRETASRLVEALFWLRDNNYLDVNTLQCLPIDQVKFGERSMFKPLYEATKAALASNPLLPRYDRGFVPACHARLGRSQELRELISPSQLAALLEKKHEILWLSGSITQDRMPALRYYLIKELNIAELAPESVVLQMDRRFLEAQPDGWVLKLYEFLDGQGALRGRIRDLPLIRLEDGKHVPARSNGQPQAFLPGKIMTGFPTVKSVVCATESAQEFLLSLGLTVPDPVDDVVRNVLHKYDADEVTVTEAEYSTDIKRILAAFATDSKRQREKLLDVLREKSFVKAIDAGIGSRCSAKPGDVYLATERLMELFGGVDGVLLVDNSCSCLRGEEVRDLLEACGSTRYLQPVAIASKLTKEERREIRLKAGLERSTSERPIEDTTLRGLDLLLNVLPQLERQTQERKAFLLWEALSELENRRGSGVFLGKYSWSYSHESKTAFFDSAFVRTLNKTPWIPGLNGEMQQAGLAVFDTLGWKPNPFLLSKIRFKPPVIDQLAREAGIDPGVLELLKKLDVTSVDKLRERLGIDDQNSAEVDHTSSDVSDAIKKILGNSPAPTSPVLDLSYQEPASPGSGATGTQYGGAAGHEEGGSRAEASGRANSKRSPGSAGGRPFISYVAVQLNEEEPDPDGIDQESRTRLEARAINFILAGEPKWQRTPTSNPGFDLFQVGPNGQPTRWCEVKAMTGSLNDRPVGLSRKQFQEAQEHGEAYWLFIVEHAGTEDARIIRIQDPAGKARTFLFDQGWRSVAESHDPIENQ